jgi:hypothetical protein
MKIMRLLGNETGRSRFSVYFFFLLLFLVIHVGMKLIPMYMDYSRMEDTMTVKAGVAQVLKDEEILSDLVAKAKELDLPLTAESFVLRRDTDRRRMAISTKGGWDVEVVFLWGAYTRIFHFEPAVEENFMSVVL